ncbi:relaxase/mobilization nuclease domain-containing protein [Aeromonas caviae]
MAVRHQDTDKDHIHIVASRVGLDGKVWLGQWEARRASVCNGCWMRQ